MKTCPSCGGLSRNDATACKHCRASFAPTTRRCPFCAEEILAAATVCRYCTREVPAIAGAALPPSAQPVTAAPAAKTRTGTKLLALVFAFFIAAFIYSQFHKPVVDPATGAKLEAAFTLATQSPLVAKVDESLSYVYVNPTIWAALDIDTKRGFARAAAYHFLAHGQTGYAHIYDNMSGKRIASMSSAGTFDVQ